MDFISNQQPQIDEMLKSMGISSIKELWKNIPESILQPLVESDDGLSEGEGIESLKKIAALNTYGQYESYIGAGSYHHYVPALVKSIISKSGFLTAYTPYQAEASQGLLQTIFEFQTAISRLTGLEIANASLYDGASACAEALLMMYRLKTDRKKLLIASNLHPHYLKVIDQYLKSLDAELVLIPSLDNGNLDLGKALSLIDESVCGLLLAYPNFYGTVEDFTLLINQAKQKEVLVSLCANPLVYGLYQSAGELGVDIAVGDCQPFGIPLQFGGPYAGYMSCKKEYARQIPGRIVGKTVDSDQKEGFVLTLQTREQHIRREKATSNICSNQALFALASLIAMLWYGPQGIYKLALTNYQRTQYLIAGLKKMKGVKICNEGAVFNEFVIETSSDVEPIFKHFRSFGIEPGLALKRFNAKFNRRILINVTEVKDLACLKRYLEVAQKIFI